MVPRMPQRCTQIRAPAGPASAPRGSRPEAPYNRPRRRPRGRLRIRANCKVGHGIEGSGKSKRREFRSYHWETGENEDDDDEDDWMKG
jgi:hypothetical protein